MITEVNQNNVSGGGSDAPTKAFCAYIGELGRATKTYSKFKVEYDRIREIKGDLEFQHPVRDLIDELTKDGSLWPGYCGRRESSYQIKYVNPIVNAVIKPHNTELGIEL